MESDLLHQLKNQLALVVAFTDLLLEETDPQERRHADIAEVHKAARAALALMPEVAKRLRQTPAQPGLTAER
jgi:hypothetical protein